MIRLNLAVSDFAASIFWPFFPNMVWRLSRESYFSYYGNDTQNDYLNNKLPKNTYFSGFDVEQLTDSRGQFYIIHPDELVINRNINGDVIK